MSCAQPPGQKTGATRRPREARGTPQGVELRARVGQPGLYLADAERPTRPLPRACADARDRRSAVDGPSSLDHVLPGSRGGQTSPETYGANLRLPQGYRIPHSLASAFTVSGCAGPKSPSAWPPRSPSPDARGRRPAVVSGPRPAWWSRLRACRRLRDQKRVAGRGTDLLRLKRADAIRCRFIRRGLLRARFPARVYLILSVM